MARYLMKYKGHYRIKPNLDLELNDVPRTEDGSIDPSYDDIYIKCAHGDQIYHFGHNICIGYVSSIGRGHNILIAIAKELKLIPEELNFRDYDTLYSLLKEDGSIFDIVENDVEIEFKFKVKHMEMVAKYLKASTYGADISPFSSKNLPKSSYVIPVDDLQEYAKITSYVPKNDLLLISHFTKEFMTNILSKDKLYKSISMKTDMRKKCLRGKEYIHSMGADYWNNYLKYLEEHLC